MSGITLQETQIGSTISMIFLINYCTFISCINEPLMSKHAQNMLLYAIHTFT